MATPLDFIEISEMVDGDNPINHEIKLSDITESGITLGRSGDVVIGSPLASEPTHAMIGRKHITLYRLFNNQRKSFDYFARRGYRNPDGTWAKLRPNSGFDIHVGNQPVGRETPINLRPGALLNLVPRVGGYQVKLHWGVVQSDPSQPPTIPVDANQINKIQFENRVLKEQNEVKATQLAQLQEVNNRITEIIDSHKQANDALTKEIQSQSKINTQQDKKIKRIMILIAATMGCLMLALGIEIEEIKTLAEMAAVVAGGGALMVTAKS